MILEYLTAALERAHYEMIRDEQPFYGEVPGLDGVWATGTTLEECRRNLSSAVEDWLLLGISRGDHIPPLGDAVVEVPRVAV